MMRKLKLVHGALLGVVALGASACASSGSGGGGGEAEAAAPPSANEVTVVIDNDRIPASSITLYVVPDTGGRRRIGTIPGSGRQTFRYTPTSRNLEFRIVAEVVGGSDVSTETFNLVGISRVEWSTSRRDVRLIR